MTEETLTRKERDRRLREDDFLRAAEQLFGANGYYETSMEDVARAAEYATGTIYRYFESKEALYRELLERKGHVFFEELKKKVPDDLSPIDELKALLRAELDWHFENHAFMQIHFEQIASRREKKAVCDLSPTMQEKYAEYLARWQDVLSRGMKDGVFNSYDPVIAVAAIKGFIEQVMHLSFDDTFEGGRNEVESFLLSFLANGLIVPKGDTDDLT